LETLIEKVHIDRAVAGRGALASQRKAALLRLKGAGFLVIVGLIIATDMMPMLTTMMRLFWPIMLAAIPTQFSLLALSVSSRSVTMGASSFVASWALVLSWVGS